MDTLGKVAATMWGCFSIIAIGFIGVLIWAPKFLGDVIYPLEIQNDGTKELKIKTYRLIYTGDKKELTVDSITLKPKQKIDIGTSHSCSKIDTTYIKVEAIEVFDEKTSVFMKRREIVEYLTTKAKEGCATYLIR